MNNEKLETIFYWLNNSKGYMSENEYKTLCKDYLNININDINYELLDKLNNYIENADYVSFKLIIENIKERG